MSYFLIHNSDGDTMVSLINKDEFLEEVANGEWGETPEFIEGLSGFPRDTNYWKGKMLIIKGEIVTLEKKEVVTKYDLP